MIQAFKPQPADDKRRTWVEYGGRVTCKQDDRAADFFVVQCHGCGVTSFIVFSLLEALEMDRKVAYVFEAGKEEMKREFRELIAAKRED